MWLRLMEANRDTPDATPKPAVPQHESAVS